MGKNGLNDSISLILGKEKNLAFKLRKIGAFYVFQKNVLQL